MITIGVDYEDNFDVIRAVMTEFQGSQIKDVAGVNLPCSGVFKNKIKKLCKEVDKVALDMTQVSKTELFKEVLEDYTKLVIKVVKAVLEKSQKNSEEIAAIGLSGLTIGEHCPPSLAGQLEPCTTQIFNPAKIAKVLQIPVIYDVCSDDVFDGGEGAPLAPMHYQHLCAKLTKLGMFPVCFISGKSTAHVSIITQSNDSILRKVVGFDCGAFTYYIKALGFKKDEVIKNNNYFPNGGEINSQLLQDLYNEAAVISKEKLNFYDLIPPKAASQSLYKMVNKLKKYPLPKEDVLRTLEYFSAYTTFLSLRFIPDDFDFPRHFILFGEGWQDPIIYRDFQNLLHGRGFILPQHQLYAKYILERMIGTRFSMGFSEDFGIDGEYMGTRVLADIAYCYLTGQKFTKPEITGCQEGSVAGIICYPNENTRRRGRGFTYSRAAKGWRSI